jgi:hypothetical protein
MSRVKFLTSPVYCDREVRNLCWLLSFNSDFCICEPPTSHLGTVNTSTTSDSSFPRSRYLPVVSSRPCPYRVLIIPPFHCSSQPKASAAQHAQWLTATYCRTKNDRLRQCTARMHEIAFFKTLGRHVFRVLRFLLSL